MLAHFRSALLARSRSLLSALFGDLSWSPPPWLHRLDRTATGWMQTHRRPSAALAGLLFIVTFGGLWLQHWYATRLVPVTVQLETVGPGLPPLTKEKPRPQLVYIKFSDSVIPVDQHISPPVPDSKLGALPPEAVRLEPPVAGHWRWGSDTTLTFYPEQEWPADRTYHITLSEQVCSDKVLLATHDLEFKTPPFTVAAPKLEFYTDPNDPSTKQVVATLEFSHRVDPAEVARHVQLSVLGESAILPEGGAPFTVTVGENARLAYVRTGALRLPEHEDFLRVRLEKGISTTQGGALTVAEVEQKIVVPDLYSYFRINKAHGEIVRNKDGEPEQILFIETQGSAQSAEIQKALHVYLLPPKPRAKNEDDKAGDQKKEWESPSEITEEILSTATELPLKLIAGDQENSELHSFRLSLETTGQLYVTIDKGTRALGGFLLGQQYTSVLPVPKLPTEITIEGAGGILALSGERKLSIKSRGVKTIDYEIARVPADQINHLVSQTRGEFQNPSFVNYHFGRENIARIATERQEINLQSRFQANYSAFDFTKHLRAAEDGGSALQGLFFLKAREWHEPKKKAEGKEEETSADATTNDDSEDNDVAEEEGDDTTPAMAQRFILVTDLGLIVKETTDGSRDIYIASIKTGEPLAGVSVEMLAKNGVAALTGQTGADGRLLFPTLGQPVKEKRPVAIVARLGQDVAFMPYDREDRELDFSRFDTGGVESRSGADLDASVFTERGIYRPGDLIHVGLMVKQRDWGGKLEGLPVEVEILDARGESAQVRKLALPAMGFAETTYQTAYGSPSGEYAVNVYLVREGKRSLLLGDTSCIVKEFLPDRMKIESNLTPEGKGGWITPEEVQSHITLRNLYGTPAVGRRIKSHMVLSPSEFSFEEYAGYTFFDRLRPTVEERKTQHEDLGEETTDESGAATVDLQLERFAHCTYALHFFTEGFEADGGRSVSACNSVLVSPLAYVVGVKAEGDLGYLPLGTQHTLHWLALDPRKQPRAVEGLECRLIEHVYVSVLTKQESGSYKYESVRREKVIRTEPVALTAEGLTYPLPTEVPGQYELALFDKESGDRLSGQEFTVVGRGNVTRSREREAELQLKLSRQQYDTGEEIELSIVAPYTGSGLITIERDQVYAHVWFKADRTSTVQHIRVPEGFEGTGYVNVCFVRGLDAKEVFLSPLSYATASFQANIEKRRLPITLRAPAKHLPGEPMRIGYKTDRPARIAIFAVDQGILQVSNYKLPDPLGHFFRKAALMVRTKQIVDLILPEYSLLRQQSAFGGDGERMLNPFKRVTEKPVVFWSGVLDAGPREQEVVYEVPDYFSGTLAIMAVALAPDAVGSVETKSLVRGPFVLTPNVPVVAAPGDLFEVSVAVANGVAGSGEQAQVAVRVEPSEHLEVVQAPKEPILIPEGREVSATFTVRARAKFGSASLLFHAALPGQQTQLRSTLSVRPAVPFMTNVRSARFTGGSAEMKVGPALHPDFRKLEATLSALPLGLARGLETYLKNYPNGCSEQITSGAFARLLLADEADFGLTKGAVQAQLEQTFAKLRQRQNDQGAFGYWEVEKAAGIDFVSVYVMHLLLEAKAAGFTPPPEILAAGLRHLQTMAALEPGSLREARTVAYAIYLLTREGVVTTNYILNVRDYLDSHHAKLWQRDLAGVYLAGAYSLLKKEDEAQRLIKAYKLGAPQPPEELWDFHTTLGADAQYIAVAARHFPEVVKKLSASEFEAITKPIGLGQFSTLSAAYAVLALKSYSHLLAGSAPELGITEISAKKETPLRLDGGALLKKTSFSAAAEKLRFTAKNQAGKIGTYYQMTEAGYEAALPTTALAEGLEVYRELVGDNGLPTQTARLGDPITVRLRLRSLQKDEVTNVAIVDLLPGGFEFAANSLLPGAGSHGCAFVEVREDRAVFFTNVTTEVREITYQIKPTNRGEFLVPPAFAESMYERTIKARALPGKVTVVDAK